MQSEESAFKFNILNVDCIEKRLFMDVHIYILYYTIAVRMWRTHKHMCADSWTSIRYGWTNVEDGGHFRSLSAVFIMLINILFQRSNVIYIRWWCSYTHTQTQLLIAQWIQWTFFIILRDQWIEIRLKIIQLFLVEKKKNFLV